MRCIVIGVGGCSNAGKTSLSQFIQDSFENVEIIHMDEFYKKDDHPDLELCKVYKGDFVNWDCLLSYDVAKFRDRFYKLYNAYSKKSKQILIVEGIFVFSIGFLQDFFTKKYFLDLPFEEGYRRRMERTYEGPEPKDYFATIAWPSYMKIKEEIKNQENIKYVDSLLDAKDIHQLIYNDIASLLQDE